MTAAEATRDLLRPESFTLALSLHGRAAGEQLWSVTPEKHAWLLRVQTDFGGVLPNLRRVQTSRLHPRTLASLGYQETDGARGKVFEASFDRKTGLATVKLGRDEASVPMTEEYHDPLSMLLWLRTFRPERAELRLTGGRVHVARLPDSELDGAAALHYILRPGGAGVFIEAAPPHRLLRLIQPTDFGPLDAVLKEPRPRREARAPERDHGSARRRRR